MPICSAALLSLRLADAAGYVRASEQGRGTHQRLPASDAPAPRATRSKIESHRFLERQASKDFVALMVFTEGSYFLEVRALHVGEHKHLDLLSIATVELCRNAHAQNSIFV